MKFPKPVTTKKKGKSKAEHDHLNLVASHPCMVCNSQNVNVHHIRESGEPRNHFKCIPLCYDHHQGSPEGLHHLGKKEFERRFGSQLEMLEKLKEEIL
jgi:membrane-bound lytic murein transglycosylase MltF